MKNRLRDALMSLADSVDEGEEPTEEFKKQANEMVGQVMGEGWTVEKFSEAVNALKLKIGITLVDAEDHPLVVTKALEECVLAASELLDVFGFKKREE